MQSFSFIYKHKIHVISAAIAEKWLKISWKEFRAEIESVSLLMGGIQLLVVNVEGIHEYMSIVILLLARFSRQR